MHALRHAWHGLDVGGRWVFRRYVLVGLWAVLFMIFTPTTLAAFMSPFAVRIVMTGVVVSAVLGAIGVLRNQHLTVEFPPLPFALAGLVYYAITQAFVSFDLHTTDRIALFALIALAGSSLVERFLFLLPKFLGRVRGTQPAVDKARATGRRRAVTK